MYLYLIRHGIAVEPDPLAVDLIADEEARSLTKLGRKKVEQVAQRLEKLELTFDTIVTSPLIRARQTADILIDNQLSPKLENDDALKPMGNIQNWLTNWNARSDRHDISTLALVGHEPNLSQWAELWIFGEVCHRLVLKKSGIIGLKFPNEQLTMGTAQLCCSIPPKYLI